MTQYMDNMMDAMLGQLTAVNTQFEVVEKKIDGVKYPFFKNLPKNLNELYQIGQQFHDKSFFIHHGKSLSYRDVLDQMGNLAHVLVSRFGIKKGDRIALAMRNLPEWCVAFMAITSVGGIAVAMNSWWKTVEFARTREQFGVPIGKFQALQHRMADMFMECEQSRSMLYMAAIELDRKAENKDALLSGAKYRIMEAARFTGQQSVQIHGGMGISDELDIGHYFKRLTVLTTLFGDSDYHLADYMAQVARVSIGPIQSCGVAGKGLSLNASIPSRKITARIPTTNPTQGSKNTRKKAVRSMMPLSSRPLGMESATKAQAKPVKIRVSTRAIGMKGRRKVTITSQT